MIEHRHRFHGHGSVRSAYRHGRLFRGQYFSLRVNNNPKRLHSRCAVVVSKKVYKSAVKRNLVRRRLYEAIRLQWPDTLAKQAKDMIITVFDARILTLSPSELNQQLAKLLAAAEQK